MFLKSKLISDVSYNFTSIVQLGSRKLIEKFILRYRFNAMSHSQAVHMCVRVIAHVSAALAHASARGSTRKCEGKHT